MVDVVIVGGGIAGLATAYELSRRGVSFVVLERSARAGGVIFSEEIDGYTIDAGPDSLLIQKPEGIRLCEEIGLGDRLIATRPPRIAYIQRGGRLHPLPAASVLGIPTRIGPLATTRLFTWRGKLRMAAEVLVPPRRDEGDESIGAFMTRRFGREATEYVAEPLLAGIHSGDVNRLSVRALFPRFVEAERTHGSVLRAFRANPESPVPNPNGVFRSLPGGLSEMVRALVRAIGEPHMRANTPVVGLGALPFPDPRFAVESIGTEPIDARAVVFAAPSYETAALLRPLDAEIARLCDEIPYNSSAAVVLAFRRDAVAHPLNGSGFVVPRVEDNNIFAASWLSSKWPHRAPADRVLLRAFVGGARDPHALNRSDPELVARVLAALRPLVGISGEPLVSRVYRWPRANAQHEVGHLARMAAIDRRLAKHPGVFVTGSGFRGIGIPDCIADGRATARAAAVFLGR